MNLKRVWTTFIFSGLLYCFLFSVEAYAFRIKGRVKANTTNKPVQNIYVTLQNGLVIFKSGYTDAEGNYDIEYSGVKQFDVVFNGNTNWYPSVSRNLDGNSDNIINPVLRARNEKINIAEAKQIIEALDYLRQLPKYFDEILEYAKLIDPSTFPKNYQQQILNDNLSFRLEAAETKLYEAERYNQRLSSQLDESIAIIYSARGGAKAAQETADAAIAGLNATNKRISSLDDYTVEETLSINFEVGSSSLNEQAKKNLNEVATRMLKLRGYIIEVAGFAESNRSEEEDIFISQQRAEAVIRYLTGNFAIPLRRFSPPIGYGKSKSIDVQDNDTPNNRAIIKVMLNRGINATEEVRPTNLEDIP